MAIVQDTARTGNADLSFVRYPSRKERFKLGNRLRRAPGVWDGASYGHRVGDRWLYDTDLYAADSVGAPALWTKLSAQLLPGDVIGVSAISAMYGVKRLLAAYVGPLFRVARASDATELDIGIATGTNEADWAALNAFGAGTSVYVVTWYDQSGNAQHATATGTARPLITPMKYIGNSRAVYFENSITNNGVGGKVKQYFTIPATLTAVTNSTSAVSLASFGHSLRSSPLFELSPTGANTRPLAMAMKRQNGLDTITVYAANGAAGQGARAFATNPLNKPHMAAQIYGLTIGSTVGIFNERELQTVGNSNTGALAGGTIGISTLVVDGVSDTDAGYNAQGALIICNTQMTFATFSAVRDSLYALFGMQPQRRGVIVCDGDSITEGAASTYFHSWPRRMMQLLDGSPKVYNVGIAGGTYASQMNSMPQWLTQAYDPTAPYNIAITAVGTNSMLSGMDADTAWSSLMAWRDAVNAQGYRYAFATIIPRSNFDASMEAVRVAHNAKLRSQWRNVGAEALLDFAGLQPVQAAGRVGWYDPDMYLDGVHPLDAMYALMAQEAARAMRSVIEE